MNTVVVGFVKNETKIFELDATTIIYFIDGIKNGTITYETSCDLDLFYIFNLKSRKSFDVLQILVQNSTILLTLESIENHPTNGESLVFTCYNKWFSNWRTEAVQSSYDWRIAIDQFSSIKLHDIEMYLKDMLDVHCFTFDNKIENDKEESYSSLEFFKTLHRESELINSIGFINTKVKDGTVQIVNDDYYTSQEYLDELKEDFEDRMRNRYKDARDDRADF